MPREELVNSAVAFLQDPSTGSAPLDKRIQFLQSKNLTQEEIDIALSRAVETGSQSNPQSASYSPPARQNQQYSYARPPAQYGYNPYMDWRMAGQPPAPPELPRRDWRDWFIMATVVGGASFGLYTLVQRYVKPLIAPPTPPQLEQDKAAIDEEFARAFALLDTLSNDTAALKHAEETRTQRLDTALEEVESVVAELKTANRRREDESRQASDEVRALLRDGIPKTIDGIREASDHRLGQLGKELSSLRMVIGNRLGGDGGGGGNNHNSNKNSLPHPPPPPPLPSLSTPTSTPQPVHGLLSPAPPAPGSKPDPHRSNQNTTINTTNNNKNDHHNRHHHHHHPSFPPPKPGLNNPIPPAPPPTLADNDHDNNNNKNVDGGRDGGASNPFDRPMAPKAAIPAWQLAAASSADAAANADASVAGGGGGDDAAAGADADADAGNT